MELRKGNVANIKASLPTGASQVTVEFVLSGKPVGGVLQVIPVNGLVVIPTPYSAVAHEGRLQVDISFYHSYEYSTKSLFFDVVTAYLELWELKEILPTETDDKCWTVESAVRNVINAHCGQSFGYYYDTKTVGGNDTNSVDLPDRLDKLATTDGFVGNPGLYRLSGDNRTITFGLPWIPGIKDDYDGLHQVGGVIYNPYGVSFKDFVFRERFSITGWWGWQSVPTPVVEATKLLVNDYACEDSAYRDRYLDSITSADWKIAFNSGAFARTGNVRADQLLEDFVLTRGWAAL